MWRRLAGALGAGFGLGLALYGLVAAIERALAPGRVPALLLALALGALLGGCLFAAGRLALRYAVYDMRYTAAALTGQPPANFLPLPRHDEERALRSILRRALDLRPDGTAHDAIAQAIAAAADIPNRLQAAMEAVAPHLPVRGAAIFFYDPERANLHPTLSWGHASLDSLAPLDAGDGLLHRVLHSPSDTLLAGSQARLVLPLPENAHESSAPLLCLPLHTTEVVGLLCLLGDSVDTAWSAERRALARSLAAQITLAVQDVRLTHALALEREQFDALATLAAELPLETELEPALARTLRTIAALAGAQHGTLLLLDRDEQVAMRVALNHDNLVPLQLVARSVIRNGLAGWALRERRAAIIADTAADTRWIPVPGLGEMRSALVVPLLHGDQALGVLTLANDRPDHFTPRHLLLASAIAAQALHRLALAKPASLQARAQGLERHLAPAAIEALDRADALDALAAPHEAHAVVLVAQLSGWDHGAERLAPAVLLEQVLRPFAQACADIVQEQGGYLDRCDATLTLAAFGHPLPAPDAAARALAAATRLRAAIGQHRRAWRTLVGADLAPVIAVASGPIAAGRIAEGPAAAYALIGPAVAQAQRLLALARPGEVLCNAGVASAYAQAPGSNGAYTLAALQPLAGAPPDEQPFRVSASAGLAPHAAQPGEASPHALGGAPGTGWPQ